MQGVMTANRGKSGTCAWCGRHNVVSKYTVYATDGAFHGARVCGRCLDEYRESLRAQLRGQYMALAGQDGEGDDAGEAGEP